MTEKKPFHNPFGALAGLRGAEAPAPAPPEVAAPATPAADPRVGRAVVRLERAGRGGKEVTVIEHLGLGDDDLRVWLRALKSALGCGGVVEGAAIALQGDHRDRLPALLTARGVRRVILG